LPLSAAAAAKHPTTAMVSIFLRHHLQIIVVKENRSRNTVIISYALLHVCVIAGYRFEGRRQE